ncbi:MAG TPA: hypothetical protein VFO69_08200 [Allosphingosinicella sp.]|nr:hypothetical protein [Allosphingosinicella sp.]
MTISGSSTRRGARYRALLAIGAGLTLAGAQPPSAPTSQNMIIVPGHVSSEREVRQRAGDFVRGTGVASGATPAARWVDPVCPRVIGVREDGARAAEAMIRRIAVDAGVPVAAESCDSNLVVTFAPDPGALIQEIGRRSPNHLSEVPVTAREALRTGSAPIRWWYTTRTIGRHGTGRSHGAGSAGQNTPATHDGSGAGSDFGGDIPTLMHYESSTISTLSQRVLNSASVVVDENAVVGMPLNAVAAYAALVALAEIRSRDFAPGGSILGLFATPDAPRRLTSQDMAFLRALYRLPLDREASSHRGMLIGDMVDQQTGS